MQINIHELQRRKRIGGEIIGGIHGSRHVQSINDIFSHFAQLPAILDSAISRYEFAQSRDLVYGIPLGERVLFSQVVAKQIATIMLENFRTIPSDGEIQPVVFKIGENIAPHALLHQLSRENTIFYPQVERPALILSPDHSNAHVIDSLGNATYFCQR